jgi:hypothetical protein
MRLPIALAVTMTLACSSSGTDAPAGDPDSAITALDSATTEVGTEDSGTDGATEAGPPAPKGSTIGALVGVNAFIDDPLDKLTAFGTVREYHNWGWNEGNFDPKYPGYPGNQLSFSMFGGYWDWDGFYAGMLAKGTEPFPAVQGSVPFVNKSAVPPVAAGADAKSAASYAAHADFMFQMAARYGAVKVEDSKLKLAPDQKRTSGLGLLHYYEDFNEPDAWWVKPDGSPVITPEEYAAMASADRDGDQGRMGKTFGIRNADPNAKLVMAGLSGKYATDWATSITDYLDGVRTWSDAHRGGELPIDVINVHRYAFGPGKPAAALSPEDDKLGERLSKIAAWRDAHAPKAELWLTEFGYDTAQASNLRAPPLGSNSPEIVQGQWILRSYLAIAEAGFDRGVLYVLRDDCTVKAAGDCGTQFETSGVTSEKGTWNPKPAFFFIATFRSRLKDMRFSKSIDSGNPDVKIDGFENAAGKKAYVVWAKTSSAKTVAGYALKIGSSSATLVTMADKKMNGDEKTLTASGGSITLDVTETPSIVLE